MMNTPADNGLTGDTEVDERNETHNTAVMCDDVEDWDAKNAVIA